MLASNETIEVTNVKSEVKSNECIGNEVEVEVPDSESDNDEFSDDVLLNSGKKYKRSRVLLEGSRRLLGDETVIGVRAETKSDAHALEMHEQAEYRMFQLELDSAGIASQASGIGSAGSSVDTIPDTENGQTLRLEIDALNYDLKKIRDERDLENIDARNEKARMQTKIDVMRVESKLAQQNEKRKQNEIDSIKAAVEAKTLVEQKKIEEINEELWDSEEASSKLRQESRNWRRAADEAEEKVREKSRNLDEMNERTNELATKGQQLVQELEQLKLQSKQTEVRTRNASEEKMRVARFEQDKTVAERDAARVEMRLLADEGRMKENEV
jgi:chromosome segregation ATPase